MNLSIRFANVEDAELIADVSRQTFYESFASQNSEADMKLFLDTQFTKGRLMLEVGAAENVFFLAYADSELAGYVKLRVGRQPKNLENKNSIEIARLYVMTPLIGKGIGNYLMAESIALAQDTGKDVVWLGVWKENIRALTFYKKWGFQIFDEVDFLLGNSIQKDWLMKKSLIDTAT